jgi:hypothetical protein
MYIIRKCQVLSKNVCFMESLKEGEEDAFVKKKIIGLAEGWRKGVEDMPAWVFPSEVGRVMRMSMSPQSALPLHTKSQQTKREMIMTLTDENCP